MQIAENTLHEILNEVDLNKNGQVELNEFLQVGVSLLQRSCNFNDQRRRCSEFFPALLKGWLGDWVSVAWVNAAVWVLFASYKRSGVHSCPQAALKFKDFFVCRKNETQRTAPVYKVYHNTDLNLAFLIQKCCLNIFKVVQLSIRRYIAQLRTLTFVWACEVVSTF